MILALVNTTSQRVNKQLLVYTTDDRLPYPPLYCYQYHTITTTQSPPHNHHHTITTAPLPPHHYHPYTLPATNIIYTASSVLPVLYWYPCATSVVLPALCYQCCTSVLPVLYCQPQTLSFPKFVTFPEWILTLEVNITGYIYIQKHSLSEKLNKHLTHHGFRGDLPFV